MSIVMKIPGEAIVSMGKHAHVPAVAIWPRDPRVLACPITEAFKVADKSWLKKPGELHDKNGIPIYPGDLLKTFHFQGSRRRKYHLYHTAVFIDGGMRMIPACELEPTMKGGGGDCLLTEEHAAEAEIIQGHGPGDCLDFCDRPRRKRKPVEAK